MQPQEQHIKCLAAMQEADRLRKKVTKLKYQVTQLKDQVAQLRHQHARDVIITNTHMEELFRLRRKGTQPKDQGSRLEYLKHQARNDWPLFYLMMALTVAILVILVCFIFTL